MDKTPEEIQAILEAAAETAPELLAEYARILAWVVPCLGHDVAKWGGITVNRTE